jgi:hypothetical protein
MSLTACNLHLGHKERQIQALEYAPGFLPHLLPLFGVALRQFIFRPVPQSQRAVARHIDIGEDF